ncbi:MAG: hypothetical protein AAFR52_17820 [Pseudomonadota bacterium]
MSWAVAIPLLLCAIGAVFVTWSVATAREMPAHDDDVSPPDTTKGPDA